MACGQCDFGWGAGEVFCNEVVPEVAGFIRDGLGHLRFTVTTNEHRKGTLDEVIAGKHGPQGVALGLGPGFATGNTSLYIAIGFGVIAQYGFPGFHVSTIIDEVKHGDPRLLRELLVHFLPAIHTHGKLKDAFVTDVGLIDDIHAGVLKLAATVTAFREGLARFVGVKFCRHRRIMIPSLG